MSVPQQDRTGSKYEKLLAASLIHLGYELNGKNGKNYLHPPKNAEVVIAGTYIQPDFVIREDDNTKAVLYVTHWSETRSSKKKYWRTWEEAAQQKSVLGNELLSIVCLFEALPENSLPELYVTSGDLPKDSTRGNKLPMGAFPGFYDGRVSLVPEVPRFLLLRTAMIGCRCR